MAFMAESNKQESLSLDSLLPPAIASKVEDIGVKKANMDVASMFVLAILAGAFIGFGAIFCTTVATGIGDKVGFGLAKLLGGLVFSLGLILVVVAGAELFTGNNLHVMAAASGKIPMSRLLRNWGIVYVGNFTGSILTAYIMYLTAQYTMANGALGATAMSIADGKCGLAFVPALTRGIYCNTLVCLAVWLTFSCRTTGDKILAILFPITAFVACGFEHSVANMYFIPVALFIKAWAPATFWTMIGQSADTYANLTWLGFLHNLVPVTLGNIIGGGVFVGAIYWVVYLRKKVGLGLGMSKLESAKRPAVAGETA
jgi:formate/nitrite transporter